MVPPWFSGSHRASQPCDGACDQALREKIGDGPFFQILRTWAEQHKDGTATTEEFIDLSQQISGQDLSNFFQVWLYTPQKPTTW